MPNAITMLKSDHATVKRLLRELSETSDRAVKQRETLVSQIERELKTHAQIEEEVFYSRPSPETAMPRTSSMKRPKSITSPTWSCRR
jgi:hemerythrin superfamily protein